MKGKRERRFLRRFGSCRKSILQQGRPPVNPAKPGYRISALRTANYYDAFDSLGYRADIWDFFCNAPIFLYRLRKRENRLIFPLDSFIINFGNGRPRG